MRRAAFDLFGSLWEVDDAELPKLRRVDCVVLLLRVRPASTAVSNSSTEAWTSIVPLAVRNV